MTALLNAAQTRAVEHVEGPLLVLAGAGSGKTRVITHRIGNLIQEHGAEPFEILALTFTNKAAGEMRKRAIELVGPSAAGTTLSTFHSACARWLRRHGRPVALTAGFSIFDSDDQVAAIRATAERIGLPHDAAAARRFRSRIEKIQHKALRESQVRERAIGHEEETFAELYCAYQDDLRRANAVDFGSLLVRMTHLLEDNDRLRDEFRRRYPFVMVDEFQDTNIAQYRLLRALVPSSGNIVVVGDDDQSIYRWRGASVENVRRFQRDYTGAELVKLEVNYRSTSSILEVAHAVVGKLPARIPKKLVSHRGEGENVRFFVGADDREEADFVARTIDRERRTRSLRYRDFAIFYRTNAQSRVFEDRLRRMGIGYRIIGGFSFFERKEIKDLIAYLRLIVNPSDEVAFRRVINTPSRGIGATTLGRLERFRRDANLGALNEAVESLVEMDDRPLSSRAMGCIRRFHELMTELRQISEVVSLREVLETLIRLTDYADYLTRTDPETAEERLRNVDELLTAADDFGGEATGGSIAEFLEYSSLRQDVDRTGLEDPTEVQMMTVHSSKGLEFPVVFVTGMERDLFPLSRRAEPATVEERHEERRLCYVACTRAEDLLFLTAARRRQLYGRVQPTEPSEFLTDPPDGHIDVVRESTAGRNWNNPARRSGGMRRRPPEFDFDQRPWAERGSESTDPNAVMRSGDVPSDGVVFDDRYFPTESINQATSYIGKRAKHNTFGTGNIVGAEPAGSKVKLNVHFPGLGVKKVILKYVEVLD